VKVEYDRIKNYKTMEINPKTEQVVYDYITNKISAREGCKALGKPANPGHMTSLIPAVVRLWVKNGTITFNKTDF
jgi:hypothetical protein